MNPRIRQSSIGLFYLVFVIVLCELTSLLTFTLIEGSSFSFEDLRNQRRQFLLDEREPKEQIFSPTSINQEVIHPYLGYVIDPSETHGYSEHGFFGEKTPFTSTNDDDLVIGIFGGSFAEQTIKHGIGFLVDEIRKKPRYSEREIIVETIALGGYKQPQQLLALTYFLSLGARFDIVINIDGFNEVALAPAENAGLVFPFYPRGWPARVGAVVDPFTLRAFGKIVTVEDRIQRRAKLFDTFPLRYSVTANVIWYFTQIRLDRKRNETALWLEKYAISRQSDFGYVATGPSSMSPDESGLFLSLVEVWRRSSLQMHKLCNENDMQYFHFLQPNQYVPGSKPMKAEEKRIAFHKNHPYRRGVLNGYDLLRQEGGTLQASGVRFFDLTMIFATNENPLYSDACCHLTTEGYAVVAREIGAAIAGSLDEPESTISARSHVVFGS